METIIKEWQSIDGPDLVISDSEAALLLIAKKLDEQNKLLKEQNDLTRQVAMHLQR